MSRDADEILSFSNASDIVELIVLTADEAFLQTLREAVGASRRLWHVPTADKVSDLLVAGQVGILVLDTQALHESAGIFLREIKRQFPDLVVVVAGTREAEATLAALISAGLVYRFIHKPMSPARARLFADAAVKKYQEHRSRAAASRLRRTGLGRRPLAVGACALALATLIAVYALRGRAGGPRIAPDPSVPATARNAVRGSAPVAAPASAAGGSAAPAATPAGATSAAPTSIPDERERLLAKAETALLEERFDDAATAIEVARNAGVETGRIAFLSAQLARSRERRLAAVTAATRGKSDSRTATPPATTASPVAPGPPAAAASPGPTAASFGLTTPAAGSAPAAGSGVPSAAPTARVETGSQDPSRSAPDAAPSQPQPAASRSDILDASTLTLLKSVPPTYPVKAALAGTEGWVELDFTVLTNGTVKNINVRAASPAGVFDDAAKNALSRWRYAAVLRDGKPAEQRVRIRLRFTLKS